MTNEHHERIQKENDVEELRRLAHVHVSENDLLRQRVQHLVTELAKERGLSEQELFEQDAASQQKAKGSSNKYGKGSRRSARNPRRDNEAPKEKPALGAAPRVEQAVLELDEADQICPDCGGELSHRASLDQHSKLITLEHTMILQIEVTRKGYACGGCDHIENALAHEEQFVAGGFYGLTLIVQILVLKYSQSMPLNRQVKFFADQGLRLLSQTMWDNTWLATKWLMPAYDAVLTEAQGALVGHADETRWNIRGGKGKAWVWTLATQDAIAFMIRKGRDHGVAQELLGDFSGYLMTDAMSAYKTVLTQRRAAIANPKLWESGKPPPGPIIRLGCWSHTRTYWCEAAEDFGSKATPIVEAIGRLYRLNEACETEGVTDELRTYWLESALAYIKSEVSGMQVQAGTSLEAAKVYTANQWDLLTVFASTRGLPMDNNFAERTLRTPVMGRKNFQGTKSERGNRVAEVMYTLVMTCHHIGVSPKLYLNAALRAAREGKVLTPSQFKAQNA